MRWPRSTFVTGNVSVLIARQVFCWLAFHKSVLPLFVFLSPSRISAVWSGRYFSFAFKLC